MQNSMDNNDNEVNLRNLFFFLLKNWRFLLLLLLVGGILGTGVSLLKRAQGRAESPKKILESTDEKDLNMDRIKLYRDYVNLYERERAYRDESLLIQMDSNAVYQGELEYLLKCTEDDMNDIGVILMDIMQSEERCSRLLAESGLTCTVKAFSELVTVDFEPEVRGEEFITESGVMIKHDARLTVLILTPDETSCTRIMSAFRDEMETLGEEIEVQFPENYISDVVKDRISFGRNDALNTKQANAVSTINTFFNQKDNFKGKLTDKELAYYEALYGTEGDAESEKNVTFSKKYPVLGAIAGFCGAGLLLVLFYLLCGKIRSAEDVTDNAGVKVLGAAKTEKKNVFADKNIERLEWKNKRPIQGFEEAIPDIAAMSFEKGAIIARTEEEKRLAEVLVEKDSRFRISQSFSEDLEAEKNLDSNEKVVFMITRWKANTKKIRQDVAIATEKGAQILGAILIQ